VNFKQETRAISDSETFFDRSVKFKNIHAEWSEAYKRVVNFP
jgi:hypothetical protein